MALTPEELKIVEFGKKQGKTPEQVLSAISKYRTEKNTVAPKTTMARVKDVGIGFAKGAGASVQAVQDLGQRAIAAVDPTSSLPEVREQTGIKALADADFTASNSDQKAGKTIEFIAEVLFPVGKLGAFAKGEKAVVRGIDTLAEKASTLSDDIVEGGLKVKDRLIQLTSKLDEKTKTALTRTNKEEFERFVQIGQKAIQDDRALTPIEEVGLRFIEGAKSVKNRADQIGAQKSVVLNKAKNAQLDVSDLVKKAALKIMKEAKELGPEDKRFAQEILDRLKPYTRNGRLKDVDTLIDDIQDGLYKLSDSEKAVQLTDRVTGIIRNAVEGMNKELQTRVGGSYAKLNRQYSQIMRLLNDVNRGVGKNGEKAGSFMKRFFSPSDAGTKKLFENMQKLTNIDYAKDARLAKFVMEALGDKRAESLLEQLPSSVPRTIGDVGKWLMSKAVEITGVDDPLEAARLFIEKQTK
jgi:hypothetical protein